MTAEIKKRGLGRGLDALFQDARKEEASFAATTRSAATRPVIREEAPRLKRADELAATAVEYKSAPNTAPRRLPVSRLRPGKYQPRQHFDDEAIANLAESISVHGVLQPLF